MQPTTAAGLCPGASARILALTDPALEKRLCDMGVLPGARVTFVRQAPLGDPCILATDACVIALRERDCRNILLCP